MGRLLLPACAAGHFDASPVSDLFRGGRRPEFSKGFPLFSESFCGFAQVFL
jgi:hypothetical protein